MKQENRPAEELKMNLLVRNEQRLEAMMEEMKSKFPDHNISIEEKNFPDVSVRLTLKNEAKKKGKP